MKTSKLNESLNTLYSKVTDIVSQSAFNNSDEVNHSLLATINHLYRATLQTLSWVETDSPWKYLQSIVLYLRLGYQHAVQNDWAEYDYQMSLALIRFETLNALV